MSALTVVSCDTSFLFSLYVHNEETERALRLMRRQEKSLQITPFLDYEFYNALHAAEFTGTIAKGSISVALSRYRRDFSEEVLKLTTVDLAACLELAKELTHKHTASFGYRAFDVLHVACALLMGANTFLTFDRNQQKLAVAEGLKSPW
jgi:predicted nucleic acid-binding protein